MQTWPRCSQDPVKPTQHLSVVLGSNCHHPQPAQSMAPAGWGWMMGVVPGGKKAGCTWPLRIPTCLSHSSGMSLVCLGSVSHGCHQPRRGIPPPPASLLAERD